MGKGTFVVGAGILPSGSSGKKRFGRGEKDNPLLDFSERANNKKAGRWARESIATQ